jgi:hypothetical protein
MMIIFKIGIGLLFLVLSGTLSASVVHAVRANVPAHRRWASTSFWIMVVAVVATELMVRIYGGNHGRGLLSIHLAFAIPFAVLLGILRFWITGVERQRLHRMLAYVCLALYGGTLGTGLVLLWKF